MAYAFRDAETGEPAYWRDVGTIDSYWEANMELCEVEPELNLYDRNWTIWTYQVQNPPAKFVFDDEGRRGEAIDSLISGGCILSGARVKRSVISFMTRIQSHTLVKDSVILPKVQIGKHCRITRAIVDRETIIPDNTVIGEDLEEDKKHYYVSEQGIVLVTQERLDRALQRI